MVKPIEVDEERALWFRAQRTLLAGEGASDPATTARTILGAQSQQIGPSLHALSLRTQGRPTAKELQERILGDDRDLVRTWGQRETIHVYDPASDWRLVVAAREQWAPAGRAGPMPSEAQVDKAFRILEKLGEPITRDDLLSSVSRAYAKQIEERAGSKEASIRFSAARLIWRMALRGDVCIAQKRGAVQSYAARAQWFPDLEWEAREDAFEANVLLARRYLALHAPASAQDIAYHFGARVRDARAWLEALESETVDVACAGRKGLVALRGDANALKEKAPTTAKQWPLRLLPLWDTQLMSHADKSWIAPDASEHKSIWKKAAMVCATAVDRGRIVATWTHKKRGKRVELEVQPLSSWRKSKHARQVEREADALAAHLGLEGASVEIKS